MSIIDNSQLVEQLVRSDAISKKDLRRGLELAKQRGESLYETLTASELIDERRLVKIVGKMLDVAPVWLGERTPDASVTDQVPRSLAARNNALPLKFERKAEDERLVMAMVDPFDQLAMDELTSHTGVEVRPVLAGPSDLSRALKRVYGIDKLDALYDSSDLESLEQAASGEIDMSEVEEGFGDVDEAGLEDDSWAHLFDDVKEVDYTEDSAVISQDMQDRAISRVLEAVEDDEDNDDGQDSLRSLDEPLSRSQITGGIEPDLGDWEIDGALDGQGDTDYAKIGHLFVYSPEKAAAHSDVEIANPDDSVERSKKQKDTPSKKAKKADNASPNKSKKAASIDNDAGTSVGLNLDDEFEASVEEEEEDELHDATAVGGGFFGPGDSEVSESSESEDETGDHTAFGFGPRSSNDDSEADSDTPADKDTAKRPVKELFIARLAELAELDEDGQRLFERADTDDLLYAALLALAQSEVLDIRELMEYLGPQ